MCSDGPSISVVEPVGVASLTVGDNQVSSSASDHSSLLSLQVLRCRAEASPAPSYSWLHQTEARPGSGARGQVQVVTRTGDLALTDIGYREAGEYRCRADNTVGGEQRSTEGQVITVKVGGSPGH